MPNTLQVTLSFKPILDGLNRFTSAIDERLQRVRAFNQQIENGAKATNQLVAQAAAALGGAGIATFFTRAIKGGVEFNATLEQARLGIAAVLKQFDSTGKFKTFDDAIKASAAAIELLKQKAKESPASFSDLVQAFQGTAGAMSAANIPLQKQVDLVVIMSQTLAGLGIRSEQILQETRALITGNINADAAAAKILGITAADITAAKQKGQLYEFLTGKVSSFGEAAKRGATSLATLRSNFGDALEQRAAKATEQLNDALKRLFTRLTELVDAPAVTTLLDMIADKVVGIVDGITSLVGWFQNLGVGGQVLLSLGNTAGTALIAIVALLAPMVALRGLLMHLPTLLNPVRSGFIAIAGVSFRQALGEFAAIWTRFGPGAAFAWTTWASRVAGAIALIGGALGVFMVGSAVISGIERAQLQRLEREEKIRETIAAQSRELRSQIGAISARDQVMKLQADAALALSKTATRIAELEAESKTRSAFSWSGSAEQTELDALREALPGRIRDVQLTLDPEWIRRQIIANQDKAFAAQRNQPAASETKEARAKADELEQKRAVFALDTAIAAAQARKDFAEEDRLTRLRDEFNLKQDLFGKELDAEGLKAANAAIQQRLDVEQAKRRKEHDEELKKTADEKRAAQEKIDLARQLADLELSIDEATAAGNQELVDRLSNRRDELQLQRDLIDASVDDAARIDEANQLIRDRLALTDQLRQKERQRAAEERALQQRLGALDIDIAGIEADRLRTQEQKNADLLPKLQAKSEALQARIEQLEQRKKTATTQEQVQIDAEIQGHQKERAGIQSQTTGATPQTVDQGLQQGTVGVLNQIGTAAEMAARGVQTVWQGVVSSIQSGLSGLITRTMTFGQALRSVGIGFAQSMLQAFTQMVAEYAAKKAMMFAIDQVMAAKSLALSLASAAKSLVAWLPSAIAASISSYGLAAAIGAAAVFALVKGFATGGLVDGGEQVIRVNEAGPEFVVNNPALRRFGPDFFAGLNAGVLNLAALPGNISRGMAAPPAIVAAGPSGGDSAREDLRTLLEDFMGRITVVNAQGDRPATRIARHSRAAGDVVRIVQDNWDQISRRGPRR